MKKYFKTGCLSIIGVFVILILIFYPSDKNNKNTHEEQVVKSGYEKKKEKLPKSQVINTDKDEKEIESNWEYFENEDKMSGSTTHIATIKSNNLLYFKFPYNGGSRSSLTIRKKTN